MTQASRLARVSAVGQSAVGTRGLAGQQTKPLVPILPKRDQK